MYTKTFWINNDPSTPINAVNLNKLEDGVGDAHADIAIVEGSISALQTTTGLHETQIGGINATLLSVDGEVSTAQTDVIDLKKYNEWRIVDDASAPSALDAALVDNIFVQRTSAATIVLPANPTNSSRVRIVDAGTDFSVNALTLSRNTQNIMGQPVDYVFDYTNGSIELSWSNIAYGWVVTRAV